jgi:hypothetical protein
VLAEATHADEAGLARRAFEAKVDAAADCRLLDAVALGNEPQAVETTTPSRIAAPNLPDLVASVSIACYLEQRSKFQIGTVSDHRMLLAQIHVFTSWIGGLRALTQ